MKIALQLYSGRSLPLADVLRTTSAAGYTSVEGYGALYAAAPALKSLLKDYGLAMPTAHVSLVDLRQRGPTVALARSLGVRLIVCPILPKEERPGDADGWRRTGAALEELARFYRSEGFEFGYHNHDFEFARFGDRYAIDLLIGEAPSVSIEVDLAWIARSGADPRAWIAGRGDAVSAVHLKDLAPAGESRDEGGWRDVGYGVMRWEELVPAIKKTRAHYFVAEHDNPSDFERFATRSIASIRGMFGATAEDRK